MDVIAVGEFLEHYGLSDDEIDEYLEHHGVKGQKWGVRKAQARAASGPDRFGNRNNKSFQRKVDRVKRVSGGTASNADKVKAVLFDIPTGHIVKEMSLKDGATSLLDMQKRSQAKVNVGKSNALDILNRLGGVDIREINFG